MGVSLEQTFVVAISSTALFDMSASDRLFREAKERAPASAVSVYRAHMQEKENEPLRPGTGQPLVRALLGLNRYQSDENTPLVDVVVMSRNSPETGMQVLNSIRHEGLGITRSAFTGGESVAAYLKAFAVDLFLTTSMEDAQRVIDTGVCATAVLMQPPSRGQDPGNEQVRIAFDGDAVLFSEESELVFQSEGLDAFRNREDQLQDVPLPEGPHARMLLKLARLQQRLPSPVDQRPIRIALVTARSSPAEKRVVNTLRHWGVDLDSAFFMGGVSKAEVLRAFRPHIYFDDQQVHLDRAADHVPSGKVPLPTERGPAGPHGSH
jgi:5'-nucleotidase